MFSIRSQHSRFQLLPHETLLEGLERTGHAVEYQCRGGYCGACRVRLLAGEVRYLDTPLAFIAADEILPCCSVPKSDLRLDCELRPELHTLQVQDDLFPVQPSLFDDLLPIADATLKITQRKKRFKNKVQSSTLSLF